MIEEEVPMAGYGYREHPQGPIFAFDKKKNGLTYVAFSVLEMVEHILTKERDDEGEPARLDEFDYYDAAGRRLDPVDQPMTLHYLVVNTEDQTDHREKIRSEVRTFVHALAPKFLGDYYFDQVMAFIDEDIDFELFAWRLAAIIRDHTTTSIPGVVFRQSKLRNLGRKAGGG
ncbi:MAG: hypothetical protein ACRDZO_07780 [Egibacteraceae bacterium]